MSATSSDPETLHPTSLRVAATFLDILFGVLLGIIVLEFPVEEMVPAKGYSAYVFLVLLYIALFAKFFFHWRGVHHDVAVFSEIDGYRATFGQYASGLFMSFGYFACIRLLVVWFKHWPHDDWPLVSLFAIVSLLKILELPANLVVVPNMAREATAGSRRVIRDEIVKWYGYGQPKIVWRFSLPVLVLVPAIWCGTALRGAAVAVYLAIEFQTEAVLFGARNRMWFALKKAIGEREMPS